MSFKEERRIEVKVVPAGDTVRLELNDIYETVIVISPNRARSIARDMLRAAEYVSPTPSIPAPQSTN